MVKSRVKIEKFNVSLFIFKNSTELFWIYKLKSIRRTINNIRRAIIKTYVMYGRGLRRTL